MKKIFLTTIIASAALLTGCSDFLDQKSETDITREVAGSQPFFMEQRVNSVYGSLTTDRTYAQDLAVTFGFNSDIEFTNADQSNYSNNEYRGWTNYYLDGFKTDAKNYDMWNELYAITENCNLIIDDVNKSKVTTEGSSKDQALMKAYRAEATVLRAMIYLDIVRLWGDVPYKETVSSDNVSAEPKGKVNRDEILDSLIKRVEEVKDDLPWAYSSDWDGATSVTTERVTKGYALGLLGQLCLTRAGWAIREGDMNSLFEGKYSGLYETATGDYADATYPTQRPVKSERDKYYKKALEAFGEVIANGPHSLAPSFEQYWKSVDQLVIDGSYESLFEIPMGLNKSGELGYSMGVRLNYLTAEYGYTNSTGHARLAAKLFYDYEKQDTRRDVTCKMITIRSSAYSDGKNTSGNKVGNEFDFFIGTEPWGIPCGKWDPRNYNDQWRDINLKANGKFGYGINVIKMRYSQLLLYYAEALYEYSGNQNTTYTMDDGTVVMSAEDALKAVRKRAYAGNEGMVDTYVSGITDFQKALIDENELEFAGESIRKFDLIRWNKLCDKIEETRQATIQASQTAINGNTVTWDENVNYYTYNGGYLIDETTFSWGGEDIKSKWPDATLVKKKGTFGKKGSKHNLATYFCAGLLGELNGSTPEVKNRYLLPISSSVISNAGGSSVISNSYGY